MSARVSRGAPSRGRNVQRRKMVLDVDLNVPLPAAESFNGEGTSSYPPSPERVQGDQAPASQEVGGGQNSALGQSEGGHLGVPPPPVTIDVDSIDDDVIVSSPRAFAEAKQNNRRNRGRTIVDVDLEDSARHAATSCNKRRRPPCQTYIDIDNLEWSINSVGDAMKSKAQARFEQLPPPPPPEPTFSCPVCMGPLVEEMSTKCGHIFCKACIKAAIAAQKKCPTCRRKLTMKDTIRIYLPAAS